MDEMLIWSVMPTLTLSNMAVTTTAAGIVLWVIEIYNICVFLNFFYGAIHFYLNFFYNVPIRSIIIIFFVLWYLGRIPFYFLLILLFLVFCFIVADE